MEDLVNSMKEMLKSTKQADDNDKYLFFSPKYNPLVKVTDWYLPQEAEPKDNDPYHTPKGNYFLSTYHRLGTDDEFAMETTTQVMLRQICEAEPVAERRKELINMACERLDKAEDPNTFTTVGPASGEMDFTTTYDYDYRHPFPYRKQLKCVLKEKPESSYGLVSKFAPSKICETKFLDDQF